MVKAAPGFRSPAQHGQVVPAPPLLFRSSRKEVNSLKNRMTLDDVLFDMRSRGMSMTKGSLGDLIENGTIPIGSVHRNIKANGKPSTRRVFLIFRSDYLRWADEKIPKGG